MIVSGTEGEGAGVYAGKNRGLQCAKPHRSDFLPVAERNLRTEELGDLNTKPAASSELKNHPTEDLKPDSIKLVSNMPISKKDRTRREQKKADEAGVRVPKKPNGNPVKAEKPKLKCEECFHMLEEKNVKQLEVHAETHAPKRTKDFCFPTAFKAA